MHPGVRIPPPLLFVLALVAAALLQRVAPLRLVPAGLPGGARVIAGALVLGGLAWIIWGVATFHRAQTAVLPTRAASRVVATGPYRYTRNPMYTGMSGIYLGVTLWLNTVWGLVLFPVVIALLLQFVVRREERYLRAAFGSDYVDYCARVRRWGVF